MKDDKGFSVLIVTKLIEGSYPNYRRVIPGETKAHSTRAKSSCTPCARAEIMTSDKQNSVKLNFTKNNLAIRIHRTWARRGLAINYKGKDMAIAI